MYILLLLLSIPYMFHFKYSVKLLLFFFFFFFFFSWGGGGGGGGFKYILGTSICANYQKFTPYYHSLFIYFLFYLNITYQISFRRLPIINSKDSIINCSTFPSFPNLEHAIPRNVRSIHWLSCYKDDRAYFARLYGR